MWRAATDYLDKPPPLPLPTTTTTPSPSNPEVEASVTEQVTEGHTFIQFTLSPYVNLNSWFCFYNLFILGVFLLLFFFLKDADCIPVIISIEYK